MSEKSNPWTHNSLQSDLANHLAATRDRIIWEDMQLGPAGSPRPDVYAVPKSYSKFRPLAYEIKISVSDFRRDVTAGKWQSYLEFACGVTFAVPAGLITKADIPTGCGLMIRGEEGWHTVKAPTLKHLASLPHEAWMKLLIDGIARQRGNSEFREPDAYRARQALMKKYGDRVAELVYEIAGAEDRLSAQLEAIRIRHESRVSGLKKSLEDERAEYKAEENQISAERALLAEALGLASDAEAWDIIQRLRVARENLLRDNEIKRLSNIVKNVSRAIRLCEEVEIL